MIARAPGKVVLSGAYAVLEGAAALVAAVDRYAIADTERAAARITPEVDEALRRRGTGRAPWFDARALRGSASDQKLGLGSSAAIVVASLAALELDADPSLDGAALAARVFPAALAAHRAAQGGGSGVDVAAAVFGGVLRVKRSAADGAELTVTSVALPAGIAVEVWSSGDAASTAGMLAAVRAARDVHGDAYRAVMAGLAQAAERAARAPDAGVYLDACRAQVVRLEELGDLARIPIVTPALRAFGAAARSRGAVVMPSGAGGGDVSLVVSLGPAGDAIAALGRDHGFERLHVELGARGVHAELTGGCAVARNEMIS